jgi:poly-gamma-glutamate synthesis protein (capsule biosynthesis protein)
MLARWLSLALSSGVLAVFVPSYPTRDPLTLPLPTSAAHCEAGTHFTLGAVGDILVHRSIERRAEKRGYDVLFQNVESLFHAANLTYANFEGTIHPGKPHSSYPAFNYSPALAVALKAAGVGVVSTANNHALDTGTQGADHTIEQLDAAGLLHHGTVKAGEPHVSYLPLTITAADGSTLRAGFISYTFSTNQIEDRKHQVNYLWSKRGDQLSDDIREAVAKARQETELVIVALHWGVEYRVLPDDLQRRGAAQLVEAGADIVLGDHPHTLQPVDWLTVGDRRALVIYSLGNFVAQMSGYEWKAHTQTTAIFFVGMTRLPSGRVVVDGYRYMPIFIEDDLQPTPIDPEKHRESYVHVLQWMRDPLGLLALPANFAAKPVAMSAQPHASPDAGAVVAVDAGAGANPDAGQPRVLLEICR